MNVIQRIFHTHQWAEPVDRIQRCEGCGIARVIECAHKYTNIAKFTGEYVFGGGECTRFTQQCDHCGDIKKFDV